MKASVDCGNWKNQENYSLNDFHWATLVKSF
jgi:hypothetical protein